MSFLIQQELHCSRKKIVKYIIVHKTTKFKHLVKQIIYLESSDHLLQSDL